MPTIEFNEAKLACLELGAGETVLLLHSSASSGAQWRSLCARLADRFAVLAPDLYGYGASDPWPGQAAMTLADEVAPLETLLASRPAPVHLVGHSYGGAVALRLAAACPSRLRSLTLIEPVAFHLLRAGGAADAALHAEIAALAGAVAAGLCTGAYRGAIERFVDYWNGSGAFAALPPEKRADLARRIGAVALNFAAAMTEPLPLRAYRQIRLPTLLLAGTASARPTRRIAALLAETLPDARLLLVAGAGHMLPLTHRDPVNGAITEHLHRHAGRLAVAA